MITDLQETIVALSTAPGIGAIAVIRLSGSDAIRITDAIFTGKKLADADSHTLHFGIIKENEIQLDEVVIGLFRNPKSYTGEDVIEISCHGSPYIQQKIIQLILSKGARLAKPGEFTMRAFLNGKMDLSQAEAVADLIASENKSAHDLAMKQMRGGYSDVLKNLRYKLIEFGALIELELDFSEEDVEFAERDHLIRITNQIKTIINDLIKSFELGNVLKQGVSAVIAGRPNAGKSTLLNALLNEERAIVSEIAGTTRDTIEEELNINGILFRLTDTAGIREAKDEIEKLGVERTFEKIHHSALLIYVFDVQNLTDKDLAEDLSKFSFGNYKLLLVGNKIDKGLFGEKFLQFEKYEPIIYISSLEKTNISELKDAMYKAIVDSAINIKSTIVSNARHLEALIKTKESLEEIIDSVEQKTSGEITALSIRRALNYLGEITGEVTHEDMLSFIFGKCCIGK